MIRVTLLFAMAAPAFSQCPFTTSSTPSPTLSFGNSTGSSDNFILPPLCKKVETISRPVSIIAANQPVYIKMSGNASVLTRVDNICLTFFPCPDDLETYKAYRSTVYIDNSSLVETYITKSFASGVNVWSNTARTYANFNLGFIGCGTYLRYSCRLIGGFPQPQLVAFGPGAGKGISQKLTDECFLNAQKLARKNGIDLLDSPGSYYLLPYKLPSRCVYKQICLPKNTSLSCQQGNSCKPQ